MATHKIKKVSLPDSTDIAGLKSSRYEKLQVSYGSIEASSYSLLDTLVFADIPTSKIISATIVVHAGSPVVYNIYPGTDISSPIEIGGVTATAKISYVIKYVRGTGEVGTDNTHVGRLQLIVGDVSTLTTSQIAALTTKQVSEMTTTQVASLTTSQIPAIETRDIAVLTTAQTEALTTEQIVALTTDQVRAISVQDLQVLSTKQLRAMETTDVLALTSTELAVLNTKQLHAFSTTQTAVLTTVQKSALTTTQLAALQ